MKTILLLSLCVLSAIPLASSQSDFYFNILSPSSVYQSLAPGEYGTASNGWGWDGTIPNDFFAEMVYASADEFGDRVLCDADGTDYSGKVVFVKRGLCEFSQKALNAQLQGALALVIQNFEDNLLHMAPGQFGANVTIPVINITESLGNQIIFEFEAGSEVYVGFSHTRNPILNISGTVVQDENADCLNTPGERSLQGWKIVTQGSNGYANINYTDANGHYQMYADTGTYEISLIAPNTSWQACPPVTISSAVYDTIEVDLPVQAVKDCPLMSVDIEVPLLRRCFSNTYKLRYCNQGTVAAQGAYVTIQFDNLVSVSGASLPYVELPGNTYEFQIGDVASNDCGNMTVIVEIPCEAEFGQTLCAIANIYPQLDCMGGGESYTGPSIKVNGLCTGTEVVFQTENVGEGDMTGSSEYIVYRNAQILETGNFQLESGDIVEYRFPADGATYRMDAKQAEGFPEVSTPGATVEGCTTEGGTFETGFFNMLPSVDYGLAYDEVCLPVIGSFDPNDKTPNPVGYGDEHFIEKNTDLHYVIRFQNTGTDTAFNVIVRDTLSGSFDISSLSLGLSSHDYSFSLIGNHVLEFRFRDIMLPDSNVNEPASHGYLTYELKQKQDIALGDVVRNSAAIYFDFNDPVITKETFHTIGENFIKTTSIEVIDKSISLQVYPNPMKEYVVFDIGNIVFKEGRVELFNAAGQLVRTDNFHENKFQVRRKDLTPGSYFFTLFLDGQVSATGMIQVTDMK